MMSPTVSLGGDADVESDLQPRAQRRRTTKVKAVADGIDTPRTEPVPLLHATLLVTCTVDVVAPEVGEAAVRLLRAAGCVVTCDLAQTCCGRPAWNAGLVEEAAAVARPTLDALEAEVDGGAEVVVVPAASCAAMVRRYWSELFIRAGDLLAAERARLVAGRTRELGEVLAEQAESLPPLHLPRRARVALHRSCHLRRELRAADQPVELLARVGGCEPVEWAGADRCCGFADLSDQATSGAGAGAATADLDAEVVVGCDTACLLHLRAQLQTDAATEGGGQPVEVRHLAEVLAEALPITAGWSAP
jgi:L-lactate dehydrogenase complex protein LldE